MRRYIQRQTAMVRMIINAACVVSFLIRQHHPGNHILICDAKLPHRDTDASSLAAVVDDDRALVLSAHAAVDDHLAVGLQLL